MTDVNTAVHSAGEVQAVIDTKPDNGIDSLIDAAETVKPDVAADVAPESEAKPEDKSPEGEETEIWSKKTRNAFRREKQEKTKLRAELQETKIRLAALEAKAPEKPQPKPDDRPASDKPSDTAPKEADFTNYADFLEARNDWKLAQMEAKTIARLQKELDEKLSANSQKQLETQQTEQEQRWVAERNNAVALKAAEMAKEIPDLPQLVDDNADVIETFSPQLQRLFLEADNAPLAFYNLAKEGKLESLATMSLSKAAMEIGRAQTQAVAKPQSKAPTPLPASRGSVAPTKSLDQMSGDELLKWVG